MIVYPPFASVVAVWPASTLTSAPAIAAESPPESVTDPAMDPVVGGGWTWSGPVIDGYAEPAQHRVNAVRDGHLAVGAPAYSRPTGFRSSEPP